MQPTYLAHPANMDASEAYAIEFRGPERADGKLEDTPYFVADAKRTARLIVWLSTNRWINAFIAEAQQAIADMEEERDCTGLTEFVGEPVPTVSVTRGESVGLA